MDAATPQISNAPYTSNAIDLSGSGSSANVSFGNVSVLSGNPFAEADTVHMRRALMVGKGLFEPNELTQLLEQQQRQQENLIMPQNTRRIVQVFIADPNENVPLDQSLIYKGEQKLTDATDQELFFEVNIRPLLEAYNANRVKITDKEASKRAGKDIFLEPVRIRDLRMVVTDIAKF